MSKPFRAEIVVCLVLGLLATGCGGSGAPRNKSFFTSGSPEADQRADQRMAKEQQLKGEGPASGETAQKASAQQVPARTTLYQRLGGQSGINAIIEDWIPRILADPRINFERKGIKRGGFNIHSNQSMTWNPNAENVAALKTHFEQFLSVATGGPARYDGMQMRQAHAGRHITNDEFDAAVGDLKASLDKMKVADKEQKELIAIVESARPAIAEER